MKASLRARVLPCYLSCQGLPGAGPCRPAGYPAKSLLSCIKSWSIKACLGATQDPLITALSLWS